LVEFNSTKFAIHVTSGRGNAIRYVIPVLWMMSCHIVVQMGQNQRWRVFFV